MNTRQLLLGILLVSVAVTNCNPQKKSLAANQVNLPEPSESKRKNSKVIGWPEGKTPVAPEGFVVTKFAGGLSNPRWIYVTPNGDILVSQSRTNKNTSPNNILIFRDADGDGKPEIQQTFMSGLKQPWVCSC